MTGDRTAKRPYDEFVADAYTTLLAEVTNYAKTKYPRGLPAGFDVADFVQHALLQQLATYERRRSEGAAYKYARKSAINALLDAVRSAHRRQLPEWLAAVAATQGGDCPTPDESAEVQARRRRVRAALDRLPDRQRQAARLMYMEGFSRDEAAAIMGETSTAVKSLAQRARAALAASLRATPGITVACAVGAATSRVRRPLAASAAVAPRLALVMCLAVVHQPPMRRLPAMQGYAAPSVAASAPRVVAAPRLVERAQQRPLRPPAARASRPTRSVAPHLARRPLAPPAKSPPPPPKVGGCVGHRCVGEVQVGDELCADHGQQDSPPVCANQDVLGVCPTAERLALPRTRCTRRSEPTFDP